MTKEPMTKRHTTGICRWVTGANELYTLQLDPCHIASSPVTSAFNQLTKKRDDPLGPILVRSRKIDLIAEHYKPSANLYRRKNNSVWRFSEFAVLLERLHDELWR